MACDGGLQRKKINTDDLVSMCNCSGGTELDKAVKFRISRSAWCTFSRVEQIRGYVPRENEHQGAHFRGWCTNSLANLCVGARLRGGNEYAVTPASRTQHVDLQLPWPKKFFLLYKATVIIFFVSRHPRA